MKKKLRKPKKLELIQGDSKLLDGNYESWMTINDIHHEFHEAKRLCKWLSQAIAYLEQGKK